MPTARLMSARHYRHLAVVDAAGGLVNRDEQGRFKRTQCVPHNITARKQMEQELRYIAASEPAHTHAGDIVVTVSIGVTTFTALDLNIDVILARADLALYRAKANGRNRVEMELKLKLATA